MVKIVSLELENVKRVALVRLEPSATGLTVIGGDNAQGKTSVLDGIMYALGGEKFRPTNLQRDGALASARMSVTLSNGICVERTGKNASLKVTDPKGSKGGQRLLDSFIDELALNLPKFLTMSGKDKAAVLLRILGIGDKLAALDKEENIVYEERQTFGRIADQKNKYFKELPWHADVPELPLSAGELVAASQAVMQRNAERTAARADIDRLSGAVATARNAVKAKSSRLDEIKDMLRNAENELTVATTNLTNADLALYEAIRTPVTADESTAEIAFKLGEMEAINAKVRQNLDKAKAKDDAEECGRKYDSLTAKVEDVRTRRAALLASADMPLPGLSVEAGELVYNGKAWDCMSSSEQVRAGVAIVRKLKPECGFVLLDKLECFDVAQLNELGAWLEAEGLQAIATRVSTGGECSIIIEDGLVAGAPVTGGTVPASAEAEY